MANFLLPCSRHALSDSLSHFRGSLQVIRRGIPAHNLFSPFSSPHFLRDISSEQLMCRSYCRFNTFYRPAPMLSAHFSYPVFSDHRITGGIPNHWMSFFVPQQEVMRSLPSSF